MSEIVDTAPVPEWVLFLGKFLGLGLVLVVWMAFLMAAGILIQAELGYPEFNMGLYLTALFGLPLADYLLFALLVLVVHVVVDQKYLGHVVALTAFGFIAFASRLGIEHHLLAYASDPGWSYSDMGGFGPSLSPWLWFKLYWAAWALLLAVTARLLLARGQEAGLGVRLRMTGTGASIGRLLACSQTTTSAIESMHWRNRCSLATHYGSTSRCTSDPVASATAESTLPSSRTSQSVSFLIRAMRCGSKIKEWTNGKQRSD